MIAELLDGLVFKAKSAWISKYLAENNLLSGKVLDLGCGYGFYSHLFDKDYVGVDNDPDRLSVARKKYPEKRFLEMSADKLEFPDNNFDLVVSFLVLHHLTDEQLVAAVREVKRVLKPGGRFLVTDLVVPDHWPVLVSPLMRLDNAERRPASQLAAIFEEAGFKVVGHQDNNLGIFATSFFAILKP